MSWRDPAAAERSSYQILRALSELSREEPVAARLRGSCMTPTLEDGQRVLIERRRLYWPGDILAFGVDGDLRAHRLLGYRPSRSGWLAVLRPDSSLSGCDPPVEPRHVLGRVVARSPGCAIDVTWRDRWRALSAFARLALRKLWRRGRRIVSLPWKADSGRASRSSGT